jgi:hypothetical protein
MADGEKTLFHRRVLGPDPQDGIQSRSPRMVSKPARHQLRAVAGGVALLPAPVCLASCAGDSGSDGERLCDLLYFPVTASLLFVRRVLSPGDYARIFLCQTLA